MKIIDHGTWVPYKPDKPQQDAPANAVYMRRESDGVDWYDYVRPNFEQLFPRKTTLPEYKSPGAAKFTPGSLVCNVYHHKHFNKHIVGTATRDPTAMLPYNQRIIEIIGFDGDDPHAEFGGKVYDHEAGTFTKLVLPTIKPTIEAQAVLDALATIMQRLDKLEKHPHK